MKRILLISLLSILLLPAFAVEFSAGAFFLHEPSGRDLSNTTGFDFTEDFSWGIVALARFDSNVTASFYATPSGIVSGDFSLDMALGCGYSFELPYGMRIEAGLSVVSTLMQAVEGSDRMYLTFNGIDAANIFTINKGQLLELLGVLRAYFAFSKSFLGCMDITLAHELNLYHGAGYLTDITFARLLGLGRTALIATYTF